MSCASRASLANTRPRRSRTLVSTVQKASTRGFLKARQHAPVVTAERTPRVSRPTARHVLRAPIAGARQARVPTAMQENFQIVGPRAARIVLQAHGPTLVQQNAATGKSAIHSSLTPPCFLRSPYLANCCSVSPPPSSLHPLSLPQSFLDCPQFSWHLHERNWQPHVRAMLVRILCPRQRYDILL